MRAMAARLSSYTVSGSPIGQFLAMLVMGIVLVGAVFMGAVVFLALLGIFAVGYSIFWVRAWWGRRMARGRGPSGPGSTPGPAKGARYIEAEYEIIEADADAARRESGTGI
jgi:hypothetical protein